MVDYGERLAWAMNERGVTPKVLSEHLHVSYQAVKKVLDGKTGAFSAPNNEEASELLGVTSKWLATGKGPRRPEHAPTLAHDAKEVGATYNPMGDPWIAEAIKTLANLNDQDRRAAVLNLRTFILALHPPSNGQALPMAA